MKILITTDLYTTATNGVVTSVRNLREELKLRGHDVRILTLSDHMDSRQEEGVYYIGSVSLEHVYPNVRMPMNYRHYLIEELIGWKPDVIHSQCEFFSFQFALRIAKHTDAPIIHTYHTLYEQYVPYVLPGKRLGEHLVRVLSRKRLETVSRVIVPSYKVENALHGYGMYNTICVVPSGISLEQHRKRITPEQRLEKRRSLGIADDRIVLLNLGRLGTEKNVEELMRYFSAAAQRREDLMFLLVGDGPSRLSLEKMAETLGVADRVIFTGMVKPEEVHEYYQLGDVFVSASTSETQGLTYVEAAANGLPLLCKQDLCLKDVLIPGENGYEFTDEAEFLDGLERLADDPEARFSAGRRSEEIAGAFDKSSFAETMEAIY
ncbi:MAG: glycosyltransferase, partial [Clostridia bacterium]|nr:glycosyltransferase [Clostridia bacterium]